MADGIGRLVFRSHAIRRMFERGIHPSDVRRILQIGEVVEDYPDDEPYPSRLVTRMIRVTTLHVVAAANTEDNETIVITVYEPNPAKWEPDQGEKDLMKCVICRHCETVEGTATVTLSRDGTMLVVKGVPARVCENCGEEYVDEDITERLLKAAEEGARNGVEVDVRQYVA